MQSLCTERLTLRGKTQIQLALSKHEKKCINIHKREDAGKHTTHRVQSFEGVMGGGISEFPKSCGWNFKVKVYWRRANFLDFLGVAGESLCIIQLQLNIKFEVQELMAWLKQTGSVSWHGQVSIDWKKAEMGLWEWVSVFLFTGWKGHVLSKIHALHSTKKWNALTCH